MSNSFNVETCILVLTNVPDKQTAHHIAQTLLEKRLAACVNILPGVHSIYYWQGKVEQAEEVTLLIKTLSRRFDEIEAEVKNLHPYDTPEIIGLPITQVLPAYLQWIVQETKRDMDV